MPFGAVLFAAALSAGLPGVSAPARDDAAARAGDEEPSPLELAPEDWPCLAHDARRTGRSPTGIRPPLRRAWVRWFHLEGVLASVQPVVASGRIYLGTLSGTLYAIDLDAGRNVWRHDLRVPVFHTACVLEEGVVVFPGGNGEVLALDARAGVTVWRRRTGAPLWSAPVEHAGRVLVAGRDGRLHAFDARNGETAFRIELGAPAAQSPAVDPERDRLYVTTEDLVVHAVDLEAGRELWRSRALPGASARSHHPVIAPDGTVAVVTVPPHGRARARQPLERARAALREAEPDGDSGPSPGTELAPDDPADEPAAGDAFGELHAALDRALHVDPYARCLFLLDPESGEVRATPPVLGGAAAATAPAPPVVLPGGSLAVTTWIPAPGAPPSDGGRASPVRLDARTGSVDPLLRPGPESGDGRSPFTTRAALRLATAGDRLLGLDARGEVLISGRVRSDAIAAARTLYSTSPGRPGRGTLVRVLRGQGDRVPRGEEDLPPWIGAGGLRAPDRPVAARRPVVPASGRVVWLEGHRLVVLAPAAGAGEDDGGDGGDGRQDRAPPDDEEEDDDDARTAGTAPPSGVRGERPPRLTEDELTALHAWPAAWDRIELPGDTGVPGIDTGFPVGLVPPPGTRQRPAELAARAVRLLSDARLDIYIWQTLIPGRLPGDTTTRRLKARLAREVEELLAEERWRPLRLPPAGRPAAASTAFDDPSLELEALALAFPWLEAGLRRRVHRRGDRLLRELLPITEQHTAPRDEGAARELWPLPAGGLDAPFRKPRVRRRGVERAWSAWAWARATDDAAALRPVWPELLASAEREPGSSSGDTGNARAAGLVALCRLAVELDDPDALERLLPAARAALRARLEHSLRFPRGDVLDRDGGRGGWRRWRHLTPALGRLLRENVRGAPGLVREVFDGLAPWWYLTRGPAAPAGAGRPWTHPDERQAGFLAQAYIQRVDPDRLATRCDIPAGRADLHSIRRVAHALLLRSHPRWYDVR